MLRTGTIARVGKGLQRVTSSISRVNVGVRTPVVIKRLNTVRYISNEPNKVFTKLSDVDDSQRDQIFKYSWGTWLKNDKIEKEKRTTRFSIEGLNDVLNALYTESKTIAKTTDSSVLADPIRNPRNSVVILPNNLGIDNVGALGSGEDFVQLRTISSIHEGKHHRIYLLTTNVPDRAFVLRIPYPRDPPQTLSSRIKSEVATADYVAQKCAINTPKVYMYSPDTANPLGTPFILEEYVEGDLLMKKWDPLANDDSEGKPPKELKKVIDLVADMHAKLNSTQFDTVGSLYFKDDIDTKGIETPTVIDNRWIVGPVTERSFWRQKGNILTEIESYVGPWKDGKGIGSLMVEKLATIERDNAKHRLALLEAGASSEIDKKDTIEGQIASFERLIKLAPALFSFSTTSPEIPNGAEILKPTLYHPDLDPMNIIISKKDGKPYLIDFEGSVIKPFILQTSPKFVDYDGPTIFNVKEDIPDYDKLTEDQKLQAQFIYKRTRNQYLWESAMNERLPKLITSMAPAMKLLRSPYTAANERKTDDEYVFLNECMIQLGRFWEDLFKNKLVGVKEYPVEFTEDEITKNTEAMLELNEKLISAPFAATQGWIPQDMFDDLLQNGIIQKDEDGNYSINPEKAPTPGSKKE